jgi:hypothetical protein
MKLKIIEGCVCDRFTVDGKDIDSLSEKELKDILKAAVAKITTTKYEDENKVSHLQTILRDIVSLFYDEYESDDEPCDCCGDFVDTFKMNISI